MNTPQTQSSVGSTDCSALWLIEILWTDSLENEIDSARGYGPEGYALTESDADALIAQAGLYTGNCWAISEPTPLRRKKRIELLSPNTAIRHAAPNPTQLKP